MLVLSHLMMWLIAFLVKYSVIYDLNWIFELNSNILECLVIWWCDMLCFWSNISVIYNLNCIFELSRMYLIIGWLSTQHIWIQLKNPIQIIYNTIFVQKCNMSHHRMTKHPTYLNSAQKSDQSDVVKYWKSYQVWWKSAQSPVEFIGLWPDRLVQSCPVIFVLSPDFYQTHQTPPDSTRLLPESSQSPPYSVGECKVLAKWEGEHASRRRDIVCYIEGKRLQMYAVQCTVVQISSPTPTMEIVSTYGRWNHWGRASTKWSGGWVKS